MVEIFNENGHRVMFDGRKYRCDTFSNRDSGYPGLVQGWQNGTWEKYEKLPSWIQDRLALKTKKEDKKNSIAPLTLRSVVKNHAVKDRNARDAQHTDGNTTNATLLYKNKD